MVGLRRLRSAPIRLLALLRKRLLGNGIVGRTLRDMLPHLAERFVYFVEDHRTIHRRIRAEYPSFEVVSVGAMTVISRGLLADPASVAGSATEPGQRHCG